MKQVSDAYIKDMNEPWRGRWFINIIIGLINEQFQAGAIVGGVNPPPMIYSEYRKGLFDDLPIDDYIATFEPDSVKADGSTSFFSENSYNYYGYISKDLSDEDNLINVDMSFMSLNNAKGLKGLTLSFFETYPTEFTIKCYDITGLEVFNKTYINDSLEFTTNDIFSEEAVKMNITFTKMNKPFVRLRLRGVLFGRGIMFSNKDIMDSGAILTTHMHPCSVILPTQDFTITIDNFDKRYDFDNPDSLINLATVGQDVNISIGYIPIDDSEIMSLPSITMELSDYNLTDNNLILNCVDFLRNENDVVIFDDPAFFTPSTTLYDVGVEIKKHLSNVTFDVILDESLKSVPMLFSHIETTVKEGFMMLASAGGCAMILENNVLRFKKVNNKNVKIKATSDNALSFSDIDSVLEPTSKRDIATFDLNDIKADASSVFPAFSVIKNSGYVSEQVCGTYGIFDRPYPVIYIDASEPISPEMIKIKFKDTHPSHIEIDAYLDGVKVDNVELTDIVEVSDVFEVNRPFAAANMFKIRVKRVHDSEKRCKIEYVQLGEKTYYLNHDTLFENPQAKLLDNVRNIVVTYTTSTKNNEGSIEDTINKITIPCNSKGSDVEYSNPFITTPEVAENVGLWLKDYYSTQLEYDIDYLGDPAIEPYDKIAVPNEFNSDIICRVENTQTVFSNGGLRGKITARRLNDDMVTSKNRLATY